MRSLIPNVLALMVALGVTAPWGAQAATDVEHEPIVLDPPRPRMPQEPTPPVVESLPPAPEVRFPAPLAGPRQLNLLHLPDIEPSRPPEPSEAERVSLRLEHFLRDAQAVYRVRSGSFEPAWIALTRRIEHHWQPDFSQIREDRISSVSGAWLADSLWRTMNGWYLETQRQRRDAFVTPPREGSDAASLASVGVLELQRDALSGQGWGNQVTTLVEVRFELDGRGTADLAESSGHPLYDEAALEAVRQALAHDQGEAPPAGPVRSVLALTSNYVILPPLPAVGFTFDIMLGHFDLFYPLKKMVNGNAQVVAIYRESKVKKPEAAAK